VEDLKVDKKKNVDMIILAALHSEQDELEVTIDGETHTIRLKRKDAEGRERIAE
jgi:DNA-directed RNA polymerase subunit L